MSAAAGTSARATAENDAPVASPTVAASVTGPAAVPNVHVACASPAVFDTEEAGVALPLVVVQTTLAPPTGFPNASVTRTVRGLDRAPATTPSCPSPLTPATAAGVLVAALAVAATGARPATCAETCWSPATLPNVHAALTRPASSVLGAAGTIVPPPDQTLHD